MVPNEGQVRARRPRARAVPKVQAALRHGQRRDGVHGRAQGRTRRGDVLPDTRAGCQIRARRRRGRPGRRRRPGLPASGPARRK